MVETGAEKDKAGRIPKQILVTRCHKPTGALQRSMRCCPQLLISKSILTRGVGLQFGCVSMTLTLHKFPNKSVGRWQHVAANSSTHQVLFQRVLLVIQPHAGHCFKIQVLALCTSNTIATPWQPHESQPVSLFCIDS